MKTLSALRTLLAAPSGRAVALVFATNSIVFGGWFVRIPEVQERLALSEGELGLGLLGLPVGALVIMLLTGSLVARFGAGRTTLVATLAFCASVATPALAVNLWTLFAALLVVGCCSGAMDVAMNAEAVAVEEGIGRPIVAACHGFFSLGGMVGAGLGAALAAIDVPLVAHLALTGLVMAALVTSQRRVLIGASADVERTSAEEAEVTFALPRGILFGPAVMAFCVFVGEGAMADWSAVYLKGNLAASAGVAGLGYAVFSLTMAVGRFLGDDVGARFGDTQVVRGGSLLAALGLGVAVVVPHPVLAIVGFAAVGFGYAGVVPILFRAGAKAPGFSAGTGIAAVASAGYAGFLAGPPVIGFVAELVGLGGGLALVAALSAGVALAAPRALAAIRLERSGV